MAISRDDFAAAFRTLATQGRAPKDILAAFREQKALLERGQRKMIAEILGLPPGPQADLRSAPAALDALGEILIELEIVTEPELQKLVASYLSRTYRKSLPPVPVPASLARFDLQWEIGRGRDGVVYRARRPEEPREVAIKLFRPDAKLDPRPISAMTDRIEPGLARTIEATPEALVMEFIEGASIDALLAERKVSLRAGFEWIEKAARILAPLHAKGLAHGSLAPGALLITRQDAVRIAEFGLKSGRPADDVFALGAILYEIATGVPPYEGFHAQELRSPSAANPSLDAAAERIILKALARDPARRYMEAGALADDLCRWLRHEDVLAEVPSAVPAPRGNRPRMAIVAAALAALAALVFLLGRSKPPPPAEQPAQARELPPPPKPTHVTSPPPKPSVTPQETQTARKDPMERAEERELYVEGSQALAKGDYDRLLALGEDFVRRGADRDFAYYWMAVAYRAKKDPEKSLEAIDAAIARAPEKIDYLQVRLPLLLARGEARRALQDIERLYGKNTAEVNAAIRSIDQEIRAGNDDPLLRLHRGALLHYKRNYRQAADEFALVVQEGNSRALYFLGLSLLRDERPAEGTEALRRFIAAHPDLADAQDARTLLAELRGE
ncbi:MAG: protein kinase [Planctomycetes bacterium]|nr:protein kinase [Planctomycetota bacterium]